MYALLKFDSIWYNKTGMEKELVEQEEQVEGIVSVGCGEIASVQLLPELFRPLKPALKVTSVLTWIGIKSKYLIYEKL